jgi:hypothetical protein
VYRYSKQLEFNKITHVQQMMKNRNNLIDSYNKQIMVELQQNNLHKIEMKNL